MGTHLANFVAWQCYRAFTFARIEHAAYCPINPLQRLARWQRH